MATYLAIIEDQRECDRCARPAGPGLAGFTDETPTGKVLPVCGACLHGLAPRLYVVWRMGREWTRPLKHVLGGASIVDKLESMPPE